MKVFGGVDDLDEARPMEEGYMLEIELCGRLISTKISSELMGVYSIDRAGIMNDHCGDSP
jgi:hypothetical protein